METNESEEVKELFELISREDVILFVGAGLSKYAGLPPAKELSELLYSQLSSSLQKELVDKKDSLQETSEVYENYYGRKKLVSTINSHFTKKNNETISEVHNTLACIPHFHIIITTNYDFAIEKALGDKCITIVSDKEISSYRSDKITLIKIHGDFNHPNDIVITKSDYNDFYTNEKLNKPKWIFVQDKINTHAVLFIGYSLEDGTIDSLLTKSYKILGSVRKKMFLINPDISEGKKYQLRKKKIKFIKMDGESFFRALDDYLMRHVLTNFVEKETSSDTMSKYASYKNFKLTTQTGDKKNKILGIDSISGEIAHEINFLVSGIDNKILDPTYCDDTIIPGDAIKNFSHIAGGLFMPHDEIGKIIIGRTPDAEFSTNFCALEEDFEINNIPTKIYHNPNNEHVVKFMFNNCVLQLNAHFQKEKSVKIVLKYIRSEKSWSVREERDVFHIISIIIYHKKFRLTNNKGESFDYKTPPETIWEGFPSHDKLLNHFMNLYTIEKKYNIKFSYITKITKEDLRVAELICKNLSGNIVPNDNSVTRMVLSFPHLSILTKNSSIKDGSLTTLKNDFESVVLHGKTINLGYLHIYIKHPTYLNPEEIKEGDNIDIELEAINSDIRVFYDIECHYNDDGSLKDKYINEELGLDL